MIPSDRARRVVLWNSSKMYSSEYGQLLFNIYGGLYGEKKVFWLLFSYNLSYKKSKYTIGQSLSSCTLELSGTVGTDP